MKKQERHITDEDVKQSLPRNRKEVFFDLLKNRKMTLFAFSCYTFIFFIPLAVDFFLFNFFEYLKTDEYLDFLLMDKDKKRRDELLDMVGLKSGLKVKTMSRGMRQRLGIAAALVNNPDIILFDEPTSALDPLGRKDVKDILLNLKDKGKTIVLSTHILADMDKICDRAGFLHNGIIAKEVDVRESADDKSYIIVGFKEKIADDFLRIFETYEKINENMVKIFIDGTSKDRSQKKIFKILSETEYEVSSISTKEHTLDDIFEEVCVK